MKVFEIYHEDKTFLNIEHIDCIRKRDYPFLGEFDIIVYMNGKKITIPYKLQSSRNDEYDRLIKAMKDSNV